MVGLLLVYVLMNYSVDLCWSLLMNSWIPECFDIPLEMFFLCKARDIARVAASARHRMTEPGGEPAPRRLETTSIHAGLENGPSVTLLDFNGLWKIGCEGCFKERIYGHQAEIQWSSMVNFQHFQVLVLFSKRIP